MKEREREREGGREERRKEGRKKGKLFLLYPKWKAKKDWFCHAKDWKLKHQD